MRGRPAREESSTGGPLARAALRACGASLSVDLESRGNCARAQSSSRLLDSRQLSTHEVSMRRIGLAVILAVSLVPLVVEAQLASSSAKIGVLSPQSRETSQATWNAFRQGLRELGWEEGRNIIIEVRFADGKLERLRETRDGVAEAQCGPDRCPKLAGCPRCHRHHLERRSQARERSARSRLRRPRRLERRHGASGEPSPRKQKEIETESRQIDPPAIVNPARSAPSQ